MDICNGTCHCPMLTTLNYRIMGAVVTALIVFGGRQQKRQKEAAGLKIKEIGLYDAEVKKPSPGVKNGDRNYHLNSVRRICLRIH